MADGTYAVDGMYAVNTFGSYIRSTPLKHVVCNGLVGHFLSEAQIENEHPYGNTITIYDDQFNKLNEIQLLQKRLQLGTEGAKYGWHSTYRASTPSSHMFIHNDRWLIFIGGYSRWWTGDEHNHLGKSIGVLDLDNLDALSYESDNAYGVTHTYTSLSFMGGLNIPRWNFYDGNFETAVIGGKTKIINSGWVPSSNQSGAGDWTPKIWIHDVDDIISQAAANPDGADGLNIFEAEQEIDIFLGDGTTKQYLVQTGFSSQAEYTVNLPQGMGPEGSLLNGDTVPSGIGGRWDYDLIPYVAVAQDMMLVTDGFKSELYEFSNGSWSSPTIIDKPFPKENVKLVSNNGLLGYQQHEKYYPQFINSEAYIVYEGGTDNDESVQYVDPFTLTEPSNYPLAYWPEAVTTSAQGQGRKIRSAYENGNLSPWISQMGRSLSVVVDYNNSGTYQVYTTNGEILDSGRWLAPGVTASNGSYNTPGIEITSINGVQVPSWKDVHENEDYAPGLQISVVEDGSSSTSLRVQIREIDLSTDPSIPIDVNLKLQTSISGISRISTSQQEIDINLTLNGRDLPSVDLTDPNVIIDVSAGALLEWPDDAFTHFALKVMKPHVPYENNAQGYVSETLLLDPSTEYVEFYVQGQALNGQQMTFDFGEGWVDSYGDSLGTVTIDLHASDIANPNPSGDEFEPVVFEARIGAVTGGEDLSVTVSTLFDNWRQNEYDTSGITTTMTRIIPIQIQEATA